MKCLKEVRKNNIPCQDKECRKWLDYEKDLNCVLESIKKNNNCALTLREVADRLGVSFVRIKQIETAAIKKLQRMQLEQLGDES
mgnify:CR=1 FL=1